MVARTRTAFHQEGLDLLKRDLLTPHRERRARVIEHVNRDIVADEDRLCAYMEVVQAAMAMQIGKSLSNESPLVPQTVGMLALYGLAEIVGEIPEMEEEVSNG